MLLEQYKRFLRKHPSGKLDLSGMKSMLKESIPEADTSGLGEHVWRIYDTNLDGEIDFREFMLALSVMSRGSAEDNLRQIFRLFDVNSDGRVEREELSRVVGELRKVGAVEGEGDLVANAFVEMDANMDGSITQEEFVAACLKENQGGGRAEEGGRRRGRGRPGGQRLRRDGRQHGREHNPGGVRCSLPQRKPGERDENFGVDSG